MQSGIPPFSMSELDNALSRMKAGKARDERGIAAEMIKLECHELRELILEVFNDILQPGGKPPKEWSKSRLIVIFKQGDPATPANYRPIAILPILYKLFSRMLGERLQEAIMQNQSVDQAAYRKSFSTEDHLLCTTLLIEKCNEFNIPVWMALVDFEKAFDTVEHEPLWEALRELGVEGSYIDLIRVLYEKQCATVLAGKESRTFDIKRGVKQGDPISPLLFLAVMECMFRRLKQRWNRLNKRRSGQYYGFVIDDPSDPLTNLRFADDVLMAAANKQDIVKMISDLWKEAEKYGLKLHMGKTKILTNCPIETRTTVPCGSTELAILANDESEKYLGRKLATKDYHDVEFANRISSGWAAFCKFKGVLCDRQVALKDRVRLLEATVTPCILYACGTWTMTAGMERKLRATKRRMLRRMIRITRAPAEPWPDFMKRATHISEGLANSNGATDWVAVQRERKLNLATKTFCYDDGRWSQRLLTWQPWFRCCPTRSIGHPVKRWDENLTRLAPR